MQQTAAERKMSPGSAASGAGCWLVTAPDAWQVQLIRGLPAKSRLALFRSSKELARAVVRNTARTKLCLSAPAGVRRYWYGNPPTEPTHVARRRTAIEALLQQLGAKELHVELDTEELQPGPIGLGSIVTAWSEKQDRYVKAAPRPAANSYMFSSMPRLQALSLNEHMTLESISYLCDALEAGRLPRLHSLGFMYRCVTVAFPLYTVAVAAVKRLAVAAGRQVTHLTARCWVLLRELLEFKKLESLAVYDTMLCSDSLSNMCTHPGLRTVTLGSINENHRMFSIRLLNHHTTFSCSWEAVTLRSTDVNVPKYLVFTRPCEVRFLGRISSRCSVEDETAFKSVLESPTVKVVCMPDPEVDAGIVHVDGLLKEHFQVLHKCEVHMPYSYMGILKGILVIWFKGLAYRQHWLRCLYASHISHATLRTHTFMTGLYFGRTFLSMSRPSLCAWDRA